MKTRILLIVCIITVVMNSGCFYVVRYDGTYSGRVVDADTRQPIEGAVVLGTWYTETPTVAGAVSNYYDARETMTDKEGEFSIPGQGLRIMSRLLPMDVLIFKSGYSYESGDWDSLKTGLYSKDKIKWEGGKPIFPLKKLSLEERRKEGSAPPLPPGDASIEKVILMLKEINKNALERGADTIDTWKGGKIYEKNN